MRAREVLLDCERGLADFEAAGLTPYWRTRWIAVVALLRSVGHVLEKTDKKQSPGLEKAINQAWNALKKTRPEPRIFWEFIREERNNVLKVYEIGARLNITITPGGPTGYNSFIRSGIYGGRDAVAVCREAIAFWGKHLDDIETAATP
jgi:hypothetical protein